TAGELRATLLRMIASPNLCSRAWVTDQYDRYVMGGTALATPDDAGVVRVDEQTGLGIALSLDGNGRFARLDPRAGAALALAESYRNVSAAGAKPLAVTDCLNFGSPEDPGVMWQFSEAVQGLALACETLGVPVTGGNVSLYNQTGDNGLDSAILPTPVIGVLGVLDDVARRTPSGWREVGQNIYLLGTTRDEFGGSEWAWAEHGHLGGMPPVLDLAQEALLGDILVQSSRDGLVDAAHDLSDGGLAQALVEAVLRYGVGARIWLAELVERDGIDAFVALFSESAGRAIVAVPREEEVRFTDMCTARGLTHLRIGVTDAPADEEPVLDVQGQFSLTLEELRVAHTATLPQHFG
ncbi:MAG: AIR synthase related protein, partial [Janthinobacterium lividum]